MNKKLNVSELVVLALCVIFALFAKRIISPFTNVITDFIRVPGGSAATAFSLLFILVGASFSRWKYAGTVSCFVQGLLALALGMSGFQGVLAPFTYAVPGIVIDILRAVDTKRNSEFFMMANGLSNFVCALVSGVLIFNFRPYILFLWLLTSACFGFAAGILAFVLHKRLIALGLRI